MSYGVAASFVEAWNSAFDRVSPWYLFRPHHGTRFWRTQGIDAPIFWLTAREGTVEFEEGEDVTNDFDDDLWIEIQMSLAEDVDRARIHVKRDEPTQVRVGRKNYTVFRNEDEAVEAAVAATISSIEEDPSTYLSPDSIREHVARDRLRDDLRSDMEESARDYIRDLSPDDFWSASFVDSSDVEPNEDGEWPEPTDEQLETAVEAYVEATDIVDFLGGDDEYVKFVLARGYVDIESFARYAVNTDGWEHTFHDESDETPAGYPYVSA